MTLAAINGSVERHRRAAQGRARARTRETAEGEPVFMTAARTGNVAAVKPLIGRGADVNAREKWFGETAVMWAAAENHADAITVLAESGADINARSHGASTRRCSSFRAAADPTRRSRAAAGRALMFAAREGAIDAARALAELGANSTSPRSRRPTFR